MAIVRLALSNPSANTDTLIHTAVRQSIVSIIATNKASSNATVRIWVQPTGATTAAQYAFLSYDTTVPANNSLETFRVALEVGDKVYVQSSTADVSFSLNGIHDSTGNYNKVYVQDGMPTATSIGDVWVSNALGYVKFWTGTAWVNAVPGSAGYAQTNEPSAPQEGQLWVDLDGLPLNEPAYPTVYYNTAAPTGMTMLNAGSIWINSSNYRVSVYTGSAWVATQVDLSAYATTASLSSYATTALLSSYATTSSLSSYALVSNPTFTGTATANNLTVIGTLIAEQSMTIALSDETTTITTGTAKVSMRAPFGMTLTKIPRASLATVSSSGLPTVDIKKNLTTIFSTLLSINANALTSVSATTPAVLSTTTFLDDDLITFDVSVAGTGAKGLKVTLYYKRI